MRSQNNHGLPTVQWQESQDHRSHLEELIDYARDGDVVLVHSMDRLDRNLDDLRSTVRRFTNKGVQLRFVKENLSFTGDDTAMTTFLLSVMGAFAEFERALIRERQRGGITLAKKAGVYKGRSNCSRSSSLKISSAF